MRYSIPLAGLVAVVTLGAGEIRAESASNAFDGAYAYSKACASCHGANGEGIYPFGVPLRGNSFVTGVPEATVIDLVKEGRDDSDKVYPAYSGMPAFKGFRKHGEIRAIVEYIKGPLQQ